MSNIFLDGFDFVDPLVWTNLSGNYITSTFATGPRSLQLSSGPSYRDLPASEEDDGMFVGFGFNGGQHTSSAQPLLTLSEGFGTTDHIILYRLSGSRGWEVKLGDGTTLIQALPNRWHYDKWHYIELGVKIANTGGTVTLKQDETTIGSFSGDTRNGGVDGLIDRIRFDQFTNVGQVRLDDVYANNEQGSAPDNTFWGVTRLWPRLPNGAGNYTQLTPVGSAINFENIDESGAANEADYNTSDVAGTKDTYPLPTLTPTVGTVRAFEIRMHAWKTDAGAKSIRSVLRNSATDVAGDDHVLALTGAPYIQRYALDPVAASAWTISSANATEVGAEVRA